MSNNDGNGTPITSAERLRVLSSANFGTTPTGNSTGSRRISRHLMARTVGLTQSRRRSLSRTLRKQSGVSADSLRERLARRRLNLAARTRPGSLPATEFDDSTGAQPPLAPSQERDDASETNHGEGLPMGLPPHFTHGHLSVVPWSAELDAVKAPELLHSEPEDFVDFRISYERYTKLLLDIGERHNTVILPKPVYDCVEEYCLEYICRMSDLLPEDMRGAPEDIDPEVLH